MASILSPMDGKAVVPVLKKAQAAKIQVIVVDSSVEKGNEGLYISYVGTDNFNAGKTAGQRMVKELGAKGNVLIVRGANGSLAGDQRVDGFKAGIQGSGLVVVGEQPGNWTNSVAMQVTENMLQANKQVDGLFSASDVMLDGILQAAGDATAPASRSCRSTDPRRLWTWSNTAPLWEPWPSSRAKWAPSRWRTCWPC